jgi:hypothetical protein
VLVVLCDELVRLLDVRRGGFHALCKLDEAETWRAGAATTGKGAG